VPATSSKRRISWDVVRVLCVFLVVLYHSTSLGPSVFTELIPRKIEFPFQVGASMLLLISAYFACVSIRKGDMARYWWNRVARILPPFLFAVVVTFFVLRLAGPEGWFTPTVRDLVGNWLMLWNWKPQDWAYIDGSYWTVPLQLGAFTAAALLWRSRWGNGRRLRALLWAAVLVPIAQWPYRIMPPPETYRTLVDGFGFHRYHLFVAGVAIWLWSTKRMSSRHFTLLLGACMAAHALHNHALGPDGLVADWGSTVALWVGMCVVTLAAGGPDWNRFVPSRWIPKIQWLAGISYGVFLMHQTIGYILMRRLQDLGVGPTLQTAAMLGCAVLLGWALTRAVEQPVHRYLLRMPGTPAPPGGARGRGGWGPPRGGGGAPRAPPPAGAAGGGAPPGARRGGGRRGVGGGGGERALG
jgi:peptidoglycan/LPS O-acetylase OafA/YrhL